VPLPPIAHVPDDEALPPSVDVAVSRGIAGICAAITWRRRSRVAVLEKGAVAAEQSSRNWGWCRVQNRDEREIHARAAQPRPVGRAAGGVGADLASHGTACST